MERPAGLRTSSKICGVDFLQNPNQNVVAKIEKLHDGEPVLQVRCRTRAVEMDVKW
jgi:hypothetical protein